MRDASGKLLGQNRITRMHKDCVLFENYRAGEFSGSSLNVYDADRKVWHQTWVDSGGGLLVIEGGLVDGKMILAGETVDAEKPGGKVDNRITWQPLPTAACGNSGRPRPTKARHGRRRSTATTRSRNSRWRMPRADRAFGGRASSA